jgi:hypothetical protein
MSFLHYRAAQWKHTAPLRRYDAIFKTANQALCEAFDHVQERVSASVSAFRTSTSDWALDRLRIVQKFHAEYCSLSFSLYAAHPTFTQHHFGLT